MLFFSLTCALMAQENIDIGASREEIDIAASYMTELKAIYERVGVRASLVALPNSRVGEYIEKSKVNAIAIKTADYSKKNKNVIRIDVPIYKNVSFRLYALKSELSRVERLSDPYVVTSLGCIGCSEFVTKYNLNIGTYQRSLKSCFDVLLKKRTDLALIPDALLKPEHFKDVVAFGDRVLTTSYYHYIHKRIAHLKPRIEEEFRRAVARGAFIPKKLVKEK